MIAASEVELAFMGEAPGVADLPAVWEKSPERSRRQAVRRSAGLSTPPRGAHAPTNKSACPTSDGGGSNLRRLDIEVVVRVEIRLPGVDGSREHKLLDEGRQRLVERDREAGDEHLADIERAEVEGAGFLRSETDPLRRIRLGGVEARVGGNRGRDKEVGGREGAKVGDLQTIGEALAGGGREIAIVNRDGKVGSRAAVRWSGIGDRCNRSDDSGDRREPDEKLSVRGR